jgi:hypothetical protein
MARGFESKDIEFQQAEAERRAVADRGAVMTPAQREARSDRRSLELTIARVKQDLAAATSQAHRTMLQQALVDLEQQLAAATTG